MKILSLHCDYIKYKPTKKALKEPEKLKNLNHTEIKNPLSIFIAVEKQDETNSEIIPQLIKEIREIANNVKSNSIVLYPYAHLSPSLSNPNFALTTLIKAEKELKKNKFKVARAPFGYYKEFELKCKGHPLAELSREINNDEFKGEMNVKGIDHKKLLNEISKSKLDTSKLKDNDHRIIGKKMDLFSFNEVAPGMVFWHNKGLFIFNKLIEFWRKEHEKKEYDEIKTPQILDKKLWQISGHWDKYKENIFISNYENKEFAVKPMNCPGGMLIYKSNPKSYRDLPLRMAELGVVHRQELSGVLGGLFRLIQFTQDDAHIFCTEKQLESEIFSIMELIDKFYKLFDFKYHVELSTKPSKRIGSDKNWNKAEMTLETALKKRKIKFKINKGDGAFYGPKIDFHIKDSLGRSWQLATIQLDFALPERFNLTYTDEKNMQARPLVLHRVIYGSLERFIGILLEHLNGNLPLWLSPVQTKIINFTDRNNKACEKLHKELINQGIKSELNLSSEPLSGKIKQAEIEKIPNIIVIGDKEEKSKSVAVRRKGKISTIKKDKFIKDILKEIEEKK